MDNFAAIQSRENDGEGLTTLFIYKVWQRLPDRNEWLRAHWPEVKGQGDWVLWQFAHPEFSGATNDLLYTTGESAANGDILCILTVFACMRSGHWRKALRKVIWC